MSEPVHPWFEYFLLWKAVRSIQNDTRMGLDLATISEAFSRLREKRLQRDTQSLYTK